MTRVIVTATDADRSCPYCNSPLKEGTKAERCDSCRSLHHEDCWRDGGGCAIPGCAEAVRTAAGTTAAGTTRQVGWPGSTTHPSSPPVQVQAPPAQAYPGYGNTAGYVPSTPPPLPPPLPSHGSRTILVIAVLVALLGIGTGVVVATGAFSNHAHTNTLAIPNAAANTTSQTPTAPAGPTPSEQMSDRHAIMGMLDTYQSSYSDHNISGLSNIFAPAITRHGLAASGCTVSRGRGAVLADYQSQFEEGSGSYELIGLSEEEIQIDGKTRAHLDAHYRITPGGTGYVNFRFAELGEGWKISEVYATCE